VLSLISCFSCRWETLGNIENDGQYLDGEFRVYTQQYADAAMSEIPEEFLRENEQAMAEATRSHQAAAPPVPTAPSFFTSRKTESDYELAKRLQEEEDVCYTGQNLFETTKKPFYFILCRSGVKC